MFTDSHTFIMRTCLRYHYVRRLETKKRGDYLSFGCYLTVGKEKNKLFIVIIDIVTSHNAL